MSIFSDRTQWMGISVLAAALSACGGTKTKSSLVTVEIDPDQPIVITADTDTKKAPWFDFRIKITNGSESSLKIIALSAELEFVDGGAVSTTEKAWSPDEQDAEQSNDSRVCTYVDFGTFSSGDSNYLTAANTSGATTCPTVTPVFTFDGAPTSKTMKSYRYRVRASPQGWFINSDGSLDRFTRFKVFTTR